MFGFSVFSVSFINCRSLLIWFSPIYENRLDTKFILFTSFPLFNNSNGYEWNTNNFYPAIDINLRLFTWHNDSHALQTFRPILCASNILMACRVSIMFKNLTIKYDYLKWALLEQRAIYSKHPPVKTANVVGSSWWIWIVLLSIEPYGYKMFNWLQMILFHQLCILFSP